MKKLGRSYDRSDISKELGEKIQEEGYELATGRVSFSRYLKEKFREETVDYRSDDLVIVSRMIDIYNET